MLQQMQVPTCALQLAADCWLLTKACCRHQLRLGFNGAEETCRCQQWMQLVAGM